MKRTSATEFVFLLAIVLQFILDPQGCNNAIDYWDITNLLAGEYRPSIEYVSNLNRSPTNRTLFVNLEAKCTYLKAKFAGYVKYCENKIWLNDKAPRCPADTIAVKTTTKTSWINPITSMTTSSTKSPINSIPKVSRDSPFPSAVTSTSPRYWEKNNSATDFVEQKPNTPASTITTKTTTKTTTTNSITRTTTSSTKLPTSTLFTFSSSTFPSITKLTQTSPLYRQNSNSATDFGPRFDYKILWISLGATGIVFILTVFVILFCQRAKIAKFLRKSENPDVVDDTFYYTDVSMGRRKNQSADDSVTYENVIPNSLLLNEPNYIELEFNVENNSNPVNAAAEINPKRDIKGYVDSVIYAELRK